MHSSDYTKQQCCINSFTTIKRVLLLPRNRSQGARQLLQGPRNRVFNSASLL
jgi:hypothetical protein